MGALSLKEGLTSGVFTKGAKATDSGQIGLVSGDASYRLYFHASGASSVYQEISTVQPKALQTLIIIKV